MSTRTDHTPRRWPLALGITSFMAMMASCGSNSPSSATPDSAAAPVAPEEFGLTLAELAARIEATESLISTCMTDAGFQYIAVDFVSVKKAMDSDQTAVGISNEEFVKQFGLGVTTQFAKPIVIFGAGPENTAYLDGLAAADQVAFRRALWGETPDWNHARALEEEDFSETGGCTRAAAEQTYTATEVGGGYINPVDKRLEQDPRMVAALGTWSDCMNAEGYKYDHPDHVDDDLRERLDAITLGQDPTTLTGPALDALTELQGEELAIASVFLGCEEEHIVPVEEIIEAELYGAPQA